MKNLIASLLIFAAVGAHAASTDTVKESTNTIPVVVQPNMDQQIEVIDQQIDALDAAISAAFAEPVQPKVPVEQKVVEIHMTAKPVLAEQPAKKRMRKEKMPLATRAGTCSGAFVSDSGDIITAKHCVEGFDTFEVQTYDRRIYSAAVVSVSSNHDLALIHIDHRNTPSFVLAENVTRGQTVFILGSPLGITDTLSTGIVARIDGDETLLDCSALPGNSGGPVFDKDENLIGILTAGHIVLFGVTHLNVAQGLDAVHFFLKEALENGDGQK